MSLLGIMMIMIILMNMMIKIVTIIVMIIVIIIAMIMMVEGWREVTGIIVLWGVRDLGKMVKYKQQLN